MLRAYFVPKHLVQILDSQRPLRRNGVERSLYSRAVGYSFNSEKIFCNKDGEVTRVPIVEHVPPDTASMIYWLNNRDPENWRQRRDVNVQGKMVTAAITMDMTPQQAAEAFAATIRGAVVEGLEDVDGGNETCR